MVCHFYPILKKFVGGPAEAKASAKWVRLRSGTKVGGPKVIRYHRSSDPKRCRPEIRRSASEYPFGPSHRETQRRAPGGVWSQD